VVHSVAFANREDLKQPFTQTSRQGFQLALDISAYSLVAMARCAVPLMKVTSAMQIVARRRLRESVNSFRRIEATASTQRCTSTSAVWPPLNQWFVSGRRPPSRLQQKVLAEAQLSRCV
jgi:NAD(P)-dependent dehydrogenase (short-subunit alcohol dehydrogenase family)